MRLVSPNAIPAARRRLPKRNRTLKKLWSISELGEAAVILEGTSGGSKLVGWRHRSHSSCDHVTKLLDEVGGGLSERDPAGIYF
jgi:hypothetical protein